MWLNTTIQTFLCPHKNSSFKIVIKTLMSITFAPVLLLLMLIVDCKLALHQALALNFKNKLIQSFTSMFKFMKAIQQIPFKFYLRLRFLIRCNSQFLTERFA